VAFAVTAAHEVERSAGVAVSEDLSEEALFWGCKLIDGNWTSGTSFDSAASALSATGQPLEGVWPYNPHRAAGISYDPPCRSMTDWHKSGLERVSSDLASVRGEIDAGRPVVLGLTVFDTLFVPTPAGRIDPPTAESPARGRHAVLVVGHDTDALLVRNSWGPTCALGGYGWLTNEYAERHIREAWAIQPRLHGPASSSEVRSTGDVYESH
jgi:Papain family cysteine protease